MKVSLYIQRGETSDAILTFQGEVPVLGQAATVVGGASSFISTSFPIGDTAEGVTLASLNINSVANWSTSDQVYVWVDSRWVGFLEFGGDWYFSTGPNAGSNANDYVVATNSAVFISRTSSGSASNSEVSMSVPYSIDPVDSAQ